MGVIVPVFAVALVIAIWWWTVSHDQVRRPGTSLRRWVYLILVGFIFLVVISQVDRPYGLYDVLDLDFAQLSGTSEEIKSIISRRFRQAAVRFHPDRASIDEKDTSDRRFQYARVARDVLSSDELRHQYNRVGDVFTRYPWDSFSDPSSVLNEGIVYVLGFYAAWWALTGLIFGLTCLNCCGCGVRCSSAFRLAFFTFIGTVLDAVVRFSERDPSHPFSFLDPRATPGDEAHLLSTVTFSIWILLVLRSLFRMTDDATVITSNERNLESRIEELEALVDYLLSYNPQAKAAATRDGMIRRRITSRS